MATIPQDPQCKTPSSAERSIETTLRGLEERLCGTPENLYDQALFLTLRDELRSLHARLRIHQTAALRSEELDASLARSPRLAETVKRLTAEQPLLLGNLDRLIRAADSIADQSLEDRDVFILRVKELIATLRRHHAEEDRLTFLATWQDIGGES